VSIDLAGLTFLALPTPRCDRYCLLVLLAVELEVNVVAVLILLDETLLDDDFFLALDMLRS